MSNLSQANRLIKGIAVTSGLAIGVLQQVTYSKQKKRLNKTFEQALQQCFLELETLIAEQGDPEAGKILEFQLALLEDEDLIDPIKAAIQSGTKSDQAWNTALDEEISQYRSSTDATFASRADDLVDLRQRVLDALYANNELQSMPQDAIALADSITPSKFLELKLQKLAGAVIANLSPTSHVAILARSYGLPLLIGTKTLTNISSGQTGFLNLEQGILWVSPPEKVLQKAVLELKTFRSKQQKLQTYASQPAITQDGAKISILANLDGDMLANINPEHFDGVGLVRTEFLFQSGLVSEQAQYAFYTKLAQFFAKKPVTIRLLDAGGDKPIEGLTLNNELNPFLGLRGVRLLLKKPSLLRTQLRAILRAAVHGDLRIMVPMVTVPEELETVREIMQAEYVALKREKTPASMPPLGLMVEVPSAAISANEFEADFYSIGSNDLIQYTTACSRDNHQLLPEPFLPAVKQLIGGVVQVGNQRGVSVSLCGDLASNAIYTESLLKLGLKNLSCAVAEVGLIKQTIASIDLAKN